MKAGKQSRDGALEQNKAGSHTLKILILTAKLHGGLWPLFISLDYPHMRSPCPLFCLKLTFVLLQVAML